MASASESFSQASSTTPQLEQTPEISRSPLGPIWRTSFKKGCGPLLLTCGSHEVRDDSTVGSANGVERVPIRLAATPIAHIPRNPFKLIASPNVCNPGHNPL